MKKIFHKTIMLALSFIMALSALTACKPNQGDSTGGIQMEEPKGTITPSNSLWDLELDTLHDVKVTAGTKDFIVNGQTDYQIVVPATILNSQTQLAANELKTFLDLATGSNIQIVTDAGLSYDASKKYISVGDTALVKSAGITVDQKVLTRSGFRIVSKDNSVFLVGGGDFGTLYAAYEFLTQEIGFEVYSQGEIYYKTEKTVKLHNFDVTDVPDIQYRMASTGWTMNGETIRNRMRLNVDREVWMGPNNMTWHNTFTYIPPEKWKDSHPKWFSNDGTQLCFNAHGDQAEYDLFFEEFMKSFIDVIERNSTVENITITQQDISTWCTCSVCSAEKTKYGTDSAVIVKFCNKVSIALEEYFKENNIDRKINICFFAYHKTTEAPVSKDEKGNYVPIDDDVICRDNVYCFYAPIFADYLRGFNDEKNLSFTETMDKWCVIAPHMYLWIYATRFNDYLTPYNAIDSMQETYIVAKAHKVDYIYDQCQWNNAASSDWMNLRAYLQSKLQWNVKADKEQLTANFMENFYKDAAEPMAKAFDTYNAWFQYLTDVKNVPGSYTVTNAVTAENYPKGFIDGMLNLFDEAYAKIAYLQKANPMLYEQLYNRICTETLVYRYMNITYHSTYYTDVELLELKKSFKADAQRVGLTHNIEWQSIETLYTNWGV